MSVREPEKCLISWIERCINRVDEVHLGQARAVLAGEFQVSFSLDVNLVFNPALGLDGQVVWLSG
jgi:hypothetical protein